MKLLCTSDIHNAFDLAEPTLGWETDIFIIAGDLTNYGMRYPKEVIGACLYLSALASRYAHVLWVPGNHDIGIIEDPFFQNMPPNCHCLLRKTIVIEGVTFYGESLAPCFDMPDLARQWAYMTADPNLDAAVWERAPKADVIISHSPPLEACDRAAPLLLADGTWERRSLGSPGLRAYIARHSPTLVVCGHIHEGVGEAWLGHTLVANVAQRIDLLDLRAIDNAMLRRQAQSQKISVSDVQ